MAENKSDFIDFLSQNDPLGLLKQKPKSITRSNRSVLLQNFEEIVNFFEEYDREPQKSSSDIYEFQLFCRLEAIRNNANMVKELKDFDIYGLLNGMGISNITLEDILGNDPLNLLASDYDSSIFEMNHVKKSDRILPEYISRRKFCQDFDTYRPMFESLHKDLEQGYRKLAVYHPQELFPNKFYVAKTIKLNRTQVRSMIRKWPPSPHQTMKIDEVVDDIISKVKGKENGIFYYKCAATKDIYELVISKKETFFHDMQRGIFYTFLSV